MTDQLEFDWPGTAAPTPPKRTDYQAMPERRKLEQELRTNSGKHFDLRITNNVSSLMSWRPGRNGDPPQFKLHHMFLRAEPGVREALSQWIRQPRAKASGSVINRFIRQHMHLIETKQPQAPSIRTQGRFHDLAAVYAEVNRAHFGGKVDAPITWGRMAASTRRRSIQFGSYTHGQRVIRIHPLLDQEFVPAYFVRYIVFHEMLHAVMGIGEDDRGRRSIHSPEFRRREKAYPDYERAKAWADDKAHFRQLLLPLRNPGLLEKILGFLGIQGREKP